MTTPDEIAKVLACTLYALSGTQEYKDIPFTVSKELIDKMGTVQIVWNQTEHTLELSLKSGIILTAVVDKGVATVQDLGYVE